MQLHGEDVARYRRHVVFAAKLCGRHTPGEFMNGRSLLTDRASITLSLMARDGGWAARCAAGGRRDRGGGTAGGQTDQGGLHRHCSRHTPFFNLQPPSVFVLYLMKNVTRRYGSACLTELLTSGWTFLEWCEVSWQILFEGILTNSESLDSRIWYSSNYEWRKNLLLIIICWLMCSIHLIKIIESIPQNIKILVS